MALVVVAIVGTITAVYAATSALGQDDLKRVLAYSTISQLGFMFLAAGVGAYAVAIFHLVSHAFFKALLFLGAGSVMHAMDGEIDVRRLGGLRREMPVTAWTFVIGALALAGLPPLAGLLQQGPDPRVGLRGRADGLWITALLAAGFTAFYIARATLLTFFGEPRHARQPHESPALMTAPLVVLAALTIAGGLLGLSATSGVIARFLGEGFARGRAPRRRSGLSELTLGLIATGRSAPMLASRLVGVRVGAGGLDRPRSRSGGLHTALARGWFLDDVYGRASSRPGKALAASLARTVDQGVIDRSMVGIGRAFAGLARVGRRLQTGFVRTYALLFLLGAVSLLLYLAARFRVKVFPWLSVVTFAPLPARRSWPLLPKGSRRPVPLGGAGRLGRSPSWSPWACSAPTTRAFAGSSSSSGATWVESLNFGTRWAWTASACSWSC